MAMHSKRIKSGMKNAAIENGGLNSMIGKTTGPQERLWANRG